MRNLPLIAFFLSLSFSLSAQNVSIPDTNFKNKLISLGIDENNDGEIQKSEANEVEELDISNSAISSIVGIESFKKLRKLNCNNNALTSLPFDISELHELRCSNNQITELNNLSYETQELDISYNKISSLVLPASANYYYLNISGNLFTSVEFNDVTLEYFYCNDTKLTSLDFSTVRRFSETISIKNNSNLASINFKNGKFDLCYVMYGGCHFYLMISNNPNLKNICADEFNHEGPTVVTETEYFQSYYNLPNITYNALCSDNSGKELGTVSQKNTTLNYKLYPNPVQNTLNIDTDDFVTVSSIKIYNTIGQTIHEYSKETLTKHTELSLSELKTGSYLIEISSGQEKTTKKFIKL
jgi:hypothetical protein